MVDAGDRKVVVEEPGEVGALGVRTVDAHVWRGQAESPCYRWRGVFIVYK